MADVEGGADALIVDGTVWPIDPESAKWSVQTKVRESIVAGTGKVGTSTKGKACFIEVKVYKPSDRQMSELEGKHDNVILRTASADVTLSQADQVGELDEEAKDSSSTVRFESATGKAVS